jgi:hypothetical protein
MGSCVDFVYHSGMTGLPTERWESLRSRITSRRTSFSPFNTHRLPAKLLELYANSFFIGTLSLAAAEKS